MIKNIFFIIILSIITPIEAARKMNPSDTKKIKFTKNDNKAAHLPKTKRITKYELKRIPLSNFKKYVIKFKKNK